MKQTLLIVIGMVAMLAAGALAEEEPQYEEGNHCDRLGQVTFPAGEDFKSHCADACARFNGYQFKTDSVCDGMTTGKMYGTEINHCFCCCNKINNDPSVTSDETS